MTPVTGDALILALAAVYKEAVEAASAFDDEATKWEGIMNSYASRQNLAHIYRQDALRSAICVIPADGLAGAMVQLEMLHLLNESGEPTDAFHGVISRNKLRDAALWSVFNVLARATGRTAEDGADIMNRERDMLRTDAATLADEWQAWFSDSHEIVRRETAETAQ